MRIKNSYYILPFLALISLSSQNGNAQHTSTTHSIDGLIAEVHRLVSRAPGESAQLEALRNLFLPTAQLTVLNHPVDSMAVLVETVSIDEFLELLQDPYYEAGYVEYETGKIIEEYNGLATVFSSFYSKDSEGQEGRGINSYQLVYVDDRWWIANLIWTTDSNGVEIPKKYLNQ